MRFCQEYDAIFRIFLSHMSAEDGMLLLCSRWENVFGGAEWSLAKGIDFHSDIERITKWLTRIFREEEFPENTEALCFSLTRAEKINTLDLRLTGSSCFVAESDGVFEDILLSESFVPKNSLAQSMALDDIYNITCGKENSPAALLLPLAFAALAASTACGVCSLPIFLNSEGVILTASSLSGFPVLYKKLAETTALPSNRSGNSDHHLFNRSEF